VKGAVVSDVHAASEALTKAAADVDVFVCLGDLVLYLDYEDPSRGIFAELFGVEHASEYIRRRTANDYEGARALSDAAWQRLGIHEYADRRVLLDQKVREQYEALFSAMPTPAYLTYGNVDLPDLWSAYLRDGHTVVDGGAVTIEGLRCGFVGGGLVSPMRTPFEQTEEQFAAKVDALGEVDVLFTHIPPKIPQLTYDTEARRFEYGSSALVEYINDVQPAFHFFGHVHQPLSARTRLGRTECVNVGHFAAKKVPFVVDLDLDAVAGG